MAIQVKVINNKFELALRKFKRKVKDSGILHELQQRQFYVKPSAVNTSKKPLNLPLLYGFQFITFIYSPLNFFII